MHKVPLLLLVPPSVSVSLALRAQTTNVSMTGRVDGPIEGGDWGGESLARKLPHRSEKIRIPGLVRPDAERWHTLRHGCQNHCERAPTVVHYCDRGGVVFSLSPFLSVRCSAVQGREVANESCAGAEYDTHLPARVPSRSRSRPIAGHQPVRAHLVENRRRRCQRHDTHDCSDKGWISLARNRNRIGSV